MADGSSMADARAAAETHMLVCDGETGAVEFANTGARWLLGARDLPVIGRFLRELVAEENGEKVETEEGPSNFALLAQLRNLARAKQRTRLTLRRLDRLHLHVDCTPSFDEQGRLVLELCELSVGNARPRDEFYQLVLEYAPLGIFHFDLNGVITACNAQFVDIIGSNRDVLVGLDLITLPDREMVRCVRAALDGRVSEYHGVYQSATADKKTPMAVSYAPVVRNGRVTGGVGIVRDDSENRALRVRLAQADRLASLGRLAAGVAHEISNPLTSVMASLDLVANHLASGNEVSADECKRFVAIAKDGAERVRRIVRDLSVFSRSDTSSLGAVDVHSVLDSALNLCRVHVRHNVRVETNYSDVPLVLADEHRLGQVFVNLIVNAADALFARRDDNRDKLIGLHTSLAADGRVIVEVRDNGHGMSPEVLQRAFEPFVTTKPAVEGTGLGLAICHGIVSSLGGEIEISSRPGDGTTVTVTLPVAGASTSTAASAAPSAAPAAASSPTPTPTLQPLQPNADARILLIDDDVHVRTSLHDLLAEQFVVSVASSANEARPMLLGDTNYSLVLCDIMMPGASGLDLYDEIREQRPQLTARFAFTSGGLLSAATHAELVATGRPVVEKPFGLREVRQLMRAMESNRDPSLGPL